MENIRSWPVADAKVSVLYSTRWGYEGSLVLWRNSARLCQVQCSEILLKYFRGEWAGCSGFVQQILSNITDAAILSALIKPFKWITKTSEATGRNQTSLVVGFLLPHPFVCYMLKLSEDISFKTLRLSHLPHPCGGSRAPEWKIHWNKLLWLSFFYTFDIKHGAFFHFPLPNVFPRTAGRCSLCAREGAKECAWIRYVPSKLQGKLFF